jgi:hypothetical protein
VSQAVFEALRTEPGAVRHPSLDSIDVLEDCDSQLALACCYELHYRSFAGVHDGWEWAPELLRLRGELEQRFVRRLEDEVGAPDVVTPDAVAPAFRALAENAGGPSLSRFMEELGTLGCRPRPRTSGHNGRGRPMTNSRGRGGWPSSLHSVRPLGSHWHDAALPGSYAVRRSWCSSGKPDGVVPAGSEYSLSRLHSARRCG